MQEITAPDSEQIFLDWGQPALLEEVQSYYDAVTGEMEESIVSSPLTLIVGPIENSRDQQTTAIHEQSARLFIARTLELPSSIDLLTARIDFAGQVFQIKSTVASHIPETIALECESIAT